MTLRPRWTFWRRTPRSYLGEPRPSENRPPLAPAPPIGAEAPSLRKNVAARYTADIYDLATSLVAATITARVLGPSGRGFYASLILLTVLLVQLFGAGLGEAAVVLPERRREHQGAVPATVAAIVPLALAGSVVFAAVGALLLDVETSDEQVALALGALLVLLNTVSSTFAWFLISRERLVTLAVVAIVWQTVTTVSLYVLTVVEDTAIAGSVLASLLGLASGFLLLIRALAREGISLKPAWSGNYLRAAARFGLAVQLSNLLVQMAGRLDLLFVYRIAGSAAAGRYSIALTIGTLSASIPTAVAHASFPRLAKLSDEEAKELTAGIFRASILAAAACSLALMVLTPFAVPLVFGSAYEAAVVPALILVPGGILWSGQWILCRAAAARGTPRPLVVSFGTSFGTMVVLDLLLIEPFGLVGAAVATLASSVIGLAIAVVYLLRSGWTVRPLIPQVSDVALILATLRQILSSLRSAASSRRVAGDL